MKQLQVLDGLRDISSVTFSNAWEGSPEFAVTDLPRGRRTRDTKQAASPSLLGYLPTLPLRDYELLQ